MIALARLLPPRDFGFAAIVVSIVAFSQLLTDLGINSALIQLERVDAGALAASFWLNTLSGFMLTGICWALSGPIAGLYGHPQVANYLRIACITFSISIGATQIGLLERAMRFRALATIECTAVLCGYGGAVAWAYGTGSADAIVVGPVLTATLLSAILWTFYPFNPFHMPAFADVRRLLRKGGGPTLFNVINYWARNSDNLSLGFVASPAELGYYSRAYAFMMAPVLQVTAGVSRALLPALARDNRDRVPLRQTYLSGLAMASLAMFPAGLLMAAAAPNIVVVLLGAKWKPMVPMLELLACSVPGQVLQGTNGAVYQAVSRNATLVRRGAVLSALTVAAILAGLPWGPRGVCVAYLARTYLVLPYSQKVPHQIAEVRWLDVIKHLRGIVPGCLVMTVVVVSLGKLLRPGWSALLCQMLFAFPAFAVTAFLADRSLLGTVQGWFHHSTASPGA
jgi:PST family polysaccharide transporter